MTMKLRTVLLSSLALAGTLAAGAARASDVYWSIGLNAPIHPGVSIGTVISNSPGYGGGYYRPAPIYYSAPAPVYYAAPAYGYYAPAPTYYAAPRHAYRHDHRHRGHDRYRGRDRDRDGIPDRWDRHPRYPDRPVYGPYGR